MFAAFGEGVFGVTFEAGRAFVPLLGDTGVFAFGLVGEDFTGVFGGGDLGFEPALGGTTTAAAEVPVPTDGDLAVEDLGGALGGLGFGAIGAAAEEFVVASGEGGDFGDCCAGVFGA